MVHVDASANLTTRSDYLCYYDLMHARFTEPLATPSAATARRLSASRVPSARPNDNDSNLRAWQRHTLALQRTIGNRAVGVVARDVAPPQRRAANDVALEFFPDNHLDAPTTIHLQQSPTLQDRVSGSIDVYVAGHGNVASIPARGGPPGRATSDGQGHTAAPTPAVSTRFARGLPHISRVWPFSKLANGTRMKDENTTYQYFDGRRWRALWKVGLKRKAVLAAELAKEYDVRVRSGTPASDFARSKNPPYVDTTTDGRTEMSMLLTTGGSVTVGLPTSWDLNDFGSMAFHVPGTQSFIHTTPVDEAQFARNLPETLEFSDGCIHIRPSDRDRLVAEGWLQGGVRFISHSYRAEREWGTPGTSTVPERYLTR